MNSLHDLITGRLSEDEGVLLSKRLLLLFLLSQIQEDVCADIERSLKGKSVYRFTIKHNHERIKNLIRSNYNDFYRNFSPQQTDMFCEDADGLTRIVNEYMGINDKIL